jgi:hypothetical protein
LCREIDEKLEVLRERLRKDAEERMIDRRRSWQQKTAELQAISSNVHSNLNALIVACYAQTLNRSLLKIIKKTDLKKPSYKY